MKRRAALLALAGAASPRPGRAARPVKVIFDTDIMGDVDDVGAVAVLHALANRGEAEILAMGVCAKHPSSAPCLDALNHYFGRPSIPIGVNKGEGFLRDSKYAGEIASGWPHRLETSDAPEAAAVFRRALARQPDRSVVLITVGQLSNVAALLDSKADAELKLDGRELARRKVKLWVSMGGKFPEGVEANIRNHAAAARRALAAWPGNVVFSGWEIGAGMLTGGKLAGLPSSSPVRRAYDLYNGLQPHRSWDQTAVLYGVRCIEGNCGGLWSLSKPGVCEVDEKGGNRWRDDPRGAHTYLVKRRPPEDAAAVIEDLMLEPGKPA